MNFVDLKSQLLVSVWFPEVAAQVSDFQESSFLPLFQQVVWW